MTAVDKESERGEREAFEAEARERGYENLRRRNDGIGRYEVAELQEAWHFWQAARASRPAPQASEDARYRWLLDNLATNGEFLLPVDGVWTRVGMDEVDAIALHQASAPDEKEKGK